MRRLLDVLLTTDAAQRVRLSQAVMAMVMMSAGVLTMYWFVWAGVVAARAVAWWTLAAVGGMVVAYLAIRSGWSRRFEDPSLTVPQMVYAVTCSAAAYALLDIGRGGVFPIVMVILMFGMFIATPRQMRAVSLYAVLLFGATMLALALRNPEHYPPLVEIGHFLMIATMMPAVSLLAERLGTMRQRARRQRADLAQALSRIRELATRDELTGLINRRHLRELMEQEHQRCIRSGHSFCLAVLDIDGFKALNDKHGRVVGDAVLRSVAHEGLRLVRVSDVFARWGGDRFVLLMSDTRSSLARSGVERVRGGIGAMRVAIAGGEVRITMSAGMAEHHAGETVEQTLERADRAAADAKAQGRDRALAAP